MKKALTLAVFLTLAVNSFASDPPGGQIYQTGTLVIDLPNRSIFIEGTAPNAEQRNFFMTNFRMEASAMGFAIAMNREAAGYIFRFEVHPYDDEYDPHIKAIILITLTHNELGMEMVSFGWPYGDLEDMYEHNQFVFYRAAVLIPSLSQTDIENMTESLTEAITEALTESITESVMAEVATTRAGSGPVDTSWRNKWIYLRASFDYPITFYAIQPTGLLGGHSAYEGTLNIPNAYSDPYPMEHKIMPQMGVTVGLEIQPLNLLSLEVNFQITRGDPRTNDFYNYAAGAELKLNLKVSTFKIQPYGAFLYHLNVSPMFSEFPDFSVGGGVYIGVRGGNSGSLFLNINYLQAFSDTYMLNKIESSPFPKEFHYKRFVLGFGLGYKFGLFNR
ncbi:MAG: hypothetical protein FWD14_04030 [Treponema sp.]|nr:hypothetical protein [Treponema sp.]